MDTLIFWFALALVFVLNAWLLRRDQMAGKWLYAPVVIMEGQEGRAALARSKVLVDRLGGALGSGRIFPLFVLVMIGVPFLAIMLSWLLLKQLDKGMSLIESVIAIATATFGILLSALLSVLLNPLIAISMASFYLKARQAGSETLTDLLDEASEQRLPYRNW
jgi:hypothetical protein